MAPTSFGRYLIIHPLGAGGMADVYLAKDPVLGRKVAIKTPRLGPEALARFDIEARAVARLEHPAIVPLYEYGNSGGQPYLVMRHMRGRSLADRIARRPLSPTEALPILARIAAALDYAHSRGVIHRDVKPGNILFDDSGHAFLSDFGIARLEERDGRAGPRLTMAGPMPGSPSYLSPEQARGDQYLDGRTDIYSLGVVIFEMLTGSRPFPLGPAQAVAGAPVIARLRPELPAGLQPVIARALAFDPGARYARAADLVRDLRQALDPGRFAPSGRSFSPWIIGGVALLILVLFWLALRDNNGNELPSPGIAAALTALGETSTATNEPPPDATSTAAPAPPSPESPSGTLSNDAGPAVQVIGRTARGTPIEAHRFGNGAQQIVFVGGITGNYAPGTIAVARQAVDYFTANPDAIPETVTLTIIPEASPDTPDAPREYRGRLNANGVDINRNWSCDWVPDSEWGDVMQYGNGGPGPFSEAETRALRDFIVNANAAAVVIWYARINNGLVSPGGCGETSLVSDATAGLYGLAAGYVVRDFGDIPGVVVNGDAANWLDTAGYPTISVLLPSATDPDWANNLAGMLAVIKGYADQPTPIPPDPIDIAAMDTAKPAPATSIPPAVCDVAPGERWSALWDRYQDRLVCAVSREVRTSGAFQFFDGGTTIWRQDADRIYVLYKDGTFASYRDDSPGTFPVSQTLWGGFGYLWTYNETVRERLGQPEDREYIASDFAVQDFRGGVVLYFAEDGAINYILFNDDRTWVEE